MADPTANALDFVGGHHDALARAAKDNAKPTITIYNKLSGGFAMLRIVCAFWRVWPDIDNVPAKFCDLTCDSLAQLNSDMIVGKGNTFVKCHDAEFPSLI